MTTTQNEKFICSNRVLMIAALCLLSLLPLTGCSSTSKTVKTAGMEDVVTVVATPLGLELREAKAGEQAHVLSEVGDEVVFSIGQKMSMLIKDIDPEVETIETSIDDEAGTITLRVVESGKNVVRLVRKCQTIERVGTGPLPTIELEKGLRPEQIVITPLCDESNSVIGYSIRYGSEERGCASQARAALRAFSRCYSDGTKKSKSKKRVEPWRALFHGER
jgi:hypothetical protein